MRANPHDDNTGDSCHGGGHDTGPLALSDTENANYSGAFSEAVATLWRLH
jgi:hypothetical protein